MSMTFRADTGLGKEYINPSKAHATDYLEHATLNCFLSSLSFPHEITFNRHFRDMGTHQFDNKRISL